MEALPKIKCFLWKTLNADVPTMANLFLKRSSPSPMCPICNAQEESIEHLLLLCPWVELVWFGGDLGTRLHLCEVTIWLAWLISCLEAVPGLKSDKQRVFSYIALTCWYIWKTRCNFLFNHQPIDPRQVLLTISTSIGAFLAATQSSSTRIIPGSRASVTSMTWIPPNSGVIKINVDASWGIFWVQISIP